MVDIDERVVQMKFDASDFDQNTKKTMSTLDKLREKLSFKDVVDNDAMNSIANNVQKVADKAYTIVDRTIDKIKDNIANKLVNFIQDNTIGQLNAGWNKYADMTTSVATLTGQGYGLKQINEQLERLMYFTDETSFKFTDMVGEIGKFTASGQSLEDATTAMMGIAEWAALSGKNANEASRAMYQLSQALGAGQMRLVDWKSIQNLNMDTKEFRQNAIDAAIAVGTLKDNLDGTYTTLVGKKKGSLSFNIREFSDKLTEGAWFTTEVMMEVYGKYSEAVDDIREVYEQGYYFDKDNKYVQINTTAQAVKEIKKTNADLISRFNKQDFNEDQINNILAKWKEIANIMDHIDDVDENGKLLASELERENAAKAYAEYLKEYSQIFQGTTEDAERALDDWQKYVAAFGLKAFEKSFEAKTFVEAIESAKDAASTVWVQIYQDIFGDYDQAKEIWTDLANTLYELFVNRLWDLEDNIIGHWKSGGETTLRKMIGEYESEIMKLKNSANFGPEEAEQVRQYEAEIERLNEQINTTTFRDGRKIFMQGIYGFGSGLKSVIMNFRDGWDSLFTSGETGEKLLTWSEKLRVSGFKFYLMMQKLGGGEDGPSPFYVNLAQGIKNLFAPINALRQIIKSVIAQFLPSGETFISTLTKLSEGFVKLTSKIVPSQETILNIARVLRGIVAFVKLIGKAFLGLYNSLLKPIISAIYTAIHDIVTLLLSALADIADELYYFEEGLNYMESMKVVGEAIGKVLKVIWNGLIAILGVILKIFAPVIGVIYRTIKAIVDSIKELFVGGTGNAFDNISKKLDDLANRAKNAWTSVNSLKDVFNHYSDQKGLAAFLMMITDMLDTLVTKIGVTIMAIFGFDEAVSTGKMSKGLQTLRDIIADIAIGIKWLYTNVIRPILGTLIEGLGNSLHTLGEQWRTGDLKGFLGTINEIIKTFTTLGLFKFIGTINKVFGAGGMLRVIRNAAKTIKRIGNWFEAKAFKEMTGGILRLAIAFTILVGAATALTFLPEENMAKMNNMLITFAIMLGVTLAAIFAISMALRKSEFSFYGFAAAMISIVAVVGIFIFAISKLHKALTGLFQIEEEYEYKDEAGNIKTGTRMREPTGKEFAARLLSLIAPIILIIGGIAATMAIIKALGGSVTLMQFGLTVAGLGVGMFMLVNAMDDLLDIFSRKDTDLELKITLATVYILGIFTVLALISRLLTNPKMMGSGSVGKSLTGALTLSLVIAAMALVVRGVLIPTLQTLADSAYSFSDYIAALIIIAAGMFTIAGVLYVMSHETGGFLNKIGAGIVFIIFAKIIQSVILPLLQSIAEMGFSWDLLGAVIIVAAICTALAGTMAIIFDALGRVITAISNLKAKELVPIILSLGITFGAIFALCGYLKKEGMLLNSEEIGLIIASIGTVILLIGLFAILINREFTKSATNMKAFSSILTALTVMVGVIALSIGGLMVAVKMLYGDDTTKGANIMLASAASILLVMAVTLLVFGQAISEIATAIKGMKTETVKQIRNMLFGLLIAIAGIMVIMVVAMKVIGDTYKDDTANMIFAFLGVILGTIAILTTITYMMESVVTELAVKLKGLTNEKVGKIAFILGETFIGIAAIMLILAVGMSVIGGVMDGYTWESLAPAIGMAGGAILSFVFITKEVEVLAGVLSKIKIEQLKYVQSTLVILLATIAGIMLVIAGGTAGILAQINGTNNWDDVLASALSIVGGAILAFMGIANTFNKLAITLSTIASFNLKNIVATMTTILIVTGLMATIMTALMNWIAGNGLGGEQNLMNAAAIILAVIVPFAALAGIIELMIPTAPKFMEAAFYISAGIAAIAAALFLLGAAAGYLREGFGIGQNLAEGVAEGIKDNTKVATDASEELIEDTDDAAKKKARIASPSKEFAKDGKYIDQGLAQGIKKNTYLAANASKALAVATNESFQKELKIASPSKVFYENGKFVIRGFVNGANSEMQKQKDLGAAMGEGFAESAKEGIEDAWKGLWDGDEMKNWIDEFAKNGGLEFGTAAGDSLFSAFLGTEEEDAGELKKQLSADAQKAIGMYDEQIRDLEWKIEGLEIHGKDLATYGAAPEAIQENNSNLAKLKSEVKKLKEKRDKIIATAGVTKKKSGGIFGGISDIFSGLGDEMGNIMSSSLLGNLSEYFNGEGLDELKQTFGDALGYAGDEGASSFTSRLFGVLGLDTDGKDSKGTFSSLGDRIGSAIGNGFLNALAAIVYQNPLSRGLAWVGWKLGVIDDDVYHVIAGDADELNQKKLNNANNLTYAGELISEYSKRNSPSVLSEKISNIDKRLAGINTEMQNPHMTSERAADLQNEKNALLSQREVLQKQYDQLNENVIDWVQINNLLVDSISDGVAMTKEQVEAELLAILADPDRDKRIIRETTAADVMEKLKSRFNENDYNMIMDFSNFLNPEYGERALNEAFNGAIAAGYVTLDKYGMKVRAGYEDKLVEFLKEWYMSGYGYNERDQKTIDSYIRFTNVYNEKMKEKYGDHFQTYNYRTVMSDKNFDAAAEELQKYFETDIYESGLVGEMMAMGIVENFVKCLQDGTLGIVPESLDEFVQFIKDYYKIKSPSEVFADEIGIFMGLGVGEGFAESVPEVLDMIGNATDLITEETVAGLNGMTSMLDHEITPTVTPVLDSSQLTSGIDTINSAVDSMAPRVDAAIGSFGYDAPNYTGNFDSLVNRINSTNELVGTLITMLESGAGVNISVTPEADPTNIYNLVIDMNRTEFKRTGRNNLAY